MKDSTHKNRFAAFAHNRAYRYVLGVSWERKEDNVCAFVCLNPSTADEVKNDPTVTRIINYAKSWGFSGVVVLNIFAYRSTDPHALKVVDDPVGILNDDYIEEYCSKAKQVIVAWGNHGDLNCRADHVLEEVLMSEKIGKPLYCLGINKTGTPKHPLYLSKDVEPMLYESI